ncbi:hypothetical protein ACFUVV_35870 [Streptomyces sp. NPDC057376]|uniref:hypothetical protein n=1 Tax=unclassified Streptomyces TaxID=2593676 RepID=UPI0018E9F15E|nr:hypothetical protein [Streptomyces sp. CB02414]
MSATPHARAAAHRARTIAAVARTRFANPRAILNADGRAALLEIAALLDAAALSLETAEPGTWDGVVITNTVDWDTSHALRSADTVAAANPAIGFPPRFTQYVTAPVFGNDVDLPPSVLPSGGAGPALIAQEGDLFARLHAVHGHLRLKPLSRDGVTVGYLKAALALHWKHARLAESVAADAARPCNQAAEPAPTGEPAPLDLTGLTPYTVGIIRLAESKGLRAADGGTYRGVRRITLNAGGKHGTFGTIQVGKASGRALRAELIHGNGGIERRAQDATAVRALVKNERVHACPDGCTAHSTADCRP